MATYDNTNSGILTKNDRKESDKHPDYRGSININGEEFWLSAWIKRGNGQGKLAGQTYMSLSASPKDDKPKSQQRSSPPANTQQQTPDDEMPF